jgi:phytoene dehydrogenase-like protein
VVSIYVHVAPHALRNGTWDTARDGLRKAALRVLGRFAPGIERLIVAEQVVTPADLEREHGFFGGHIFHGELALDQLFTMRPVLGQAQYRSPVNGLYLCGGGTHPGGFFSGGSGRNAAREVAKDLKS